MPQQTHQAGTASAGRNTTAEGMGNPETFNDHMMVFQSQLTAMKQDVLAAQNAV